MPALQYHLDGATDRDLVVLVTHNGITHSVVRKDSNLTGLDEDLLFNLRDYAMRAELDHLRAIGRIV